MAKRIILFVMGMVILIACQPGTILAEYQPKAFVYPPDTLRIPGAITLLAETPYYANPSDTEAPIGSFSSQAELRVLAGAYTWTQAQSWWKVESPNGPVWIYPLPWTLVIPPPERVMLFKDTSLYEERKVTSAFVNTASSQEMRVTEADPMWFYTNDPNEKHWLRIWAGDLGERWVFLPVNQIGYMKPVDYYAYYMNQTLLDNPNYSGPLVSKAGPIFPSLLNQTVHVTGEYVTVYATSYLIETVEGVKYAKENGRKVIRGKESLTVKSDTPLYAIPGVSAAWMPILPPQTVEAFEKMEDAPLYHIRTEVGDVWINTEDSEPTDWVEPDYSIELRGTHALYRFPKSQFQIRGASLEGRTVQPKGYWRDADGTDWYLLETKLGNVWITSNPVQDRLHPRNGTPSTYVTYKQTILDTVQVKGRELTVGKTPIGYMSEDQLTYFSLDYLIQRFGYEQEEGLLADIAIRSIQPSSQYSIRLNPQSGEATTYWADQEAERFTLQHSLVVQDGHYWIEGEDAQRLFGLSMDWWSSGETFYLFSDEYEVELSPLPKSARVSGLNYIVNRYERPVGPHDAKPKEPLQFLITNRTLSSSAQWDYSETVSVAGNLPRVNRIQQKGVIPVTEGTNQLHIVVKIGSKILANQAATIAGEN
ncbi:hypothetical protein [Paenibacillus ginsengarvi]|uniref:Uncharacterized protein n=1 Tax=Paenibacillus ginsengarvi TaxID=400777 RepID=A0A3B0CTZ5_9BACL|nr:hypothetical protein [Paenibacillus ginsengarvi]RKN86136.1 hypothetical protein D7M11_03755 [Paenibacillus ginsengarvi]